jgi:hypothetical protein
MKKEVCSDAKTIAWAKTKVIYLLLQLEVHHNVAASVNENANGLHAASFNTRKQFQHVEVVSTLGST